MALTTSVGAVDESQLEDAMKKLAERLAQRAERLAQSLEPWKAHLGKLTLYCGLGMVLLGFPAQIYSNWRTGACGIDPVLITVALLLYVVRIPYQVSARAWWLLPADVLGMVLSGVLIVQYLYY